MTAQLIRLCVSHRSLVLFGAAILTVFGIYALRNTPVDALPDLSDVQVIIRTPYPGQAPRLVEDRITYPLSRAMLTVPRTKAVRGFSAFGDSFVYIIFEDGTDLYWARSRVLENLSAASAGLPDGVVPSLGPDATGVGWILEYALVDRSGTADLADLRAIQDWLIRFELSGVPGVSEVASVGGVVKEYQIVPDPAELSRRGVMLEDLIEKVKASNQEAGGSVIEQAGAEYMIRATGYLESLEDFRKIPVKTSAAGVPVFLGDVARIDIGPEMRRGIAELDGEGEVAGGIVLMRQGENARRVIESVRERLEEIKKSLPEGVEIVTVYDRATLIDSAVDHLKGKLTEEFAVVALTCVLFLLHFRSSLVAIITLPLGLLISFIVMYFQGVSANIMSLGGLAIAIGTMVDASIVMVENAAKKMEKYRREHPGEAFDPDVHWRLVTEASVEVGPAIFVSLLVITMSFIPVFSLQGQEGRLFSPLAFTKTYAMAGAAFLSVTLVPVLMGFMVRGKVPREDTNPVNRFLISLYHPLLNVALKKPRVTLAAAVLVAVGSLYPYSRLGGEFLPRIDEGDLLYMPSTLPGLSSAEAARTLQVTSRLIKSLPEVDTVFGKAGRAETATDPAPLEMIETAIHLKPRDQWRPGMTGEKIVEELDRTVRLPGLANLWVPPIRNRIDMISTGVKSPVGVKISGSRPEDIDRAAFDVQEAAKKVRGVTSALAETRGQGRYVEVRLDRERAARYGLTVAQAQIFVESAVGGMSIGETVEGTARFPINVRYPQEYRDSLDSLRSLPVLTPLENEITLSDIADVDVLKGASMLKSEQGRPAVWVYLDIRGRDIKSVVDDLREEIDRNVELPPGVSAAFTGQYEMMERANRRLAVMIPVTLLIILLLLYSEFKAWTETLFIMCSLPFALGGGLWFMHFAGWSLSVASGVGFIALAGLAAEFGVIMLIYLREAVRERPDFKDPDKITPELIDETIHAGAVLRVRPKAMTVGTIVVSLIPVLWSEGTGSEVMKRISAPLFGGMVTAFTLSMFILPAAWKIKLQLMGRFGRSKNARRKLTIKKPSIG
ncbi:MAG: CusA/CzcA family heavy metal efflux RND transporter [Deltaproteobacteria bacterium]|jgi:Cu(I)/Ag(I) efflux system membrane protein CusA/SilA|nr:CusA/CzcA family heavy metal efflux RND transporter [Deltaproteobacteria bacterium]